MCCIRLQSRSKKITFVVRVMLYFVRKYPGTKVTLPVKTVRTIYGSAFGWKPSLLLKKLQWFSDKGAQPVFAVIKENQVTKATQCEVLFHPTVLTVVSRESSEVYQKGVQGLFGGISDVAKAAFDLAEREMLGELEGWTERNLEKAFITQVLLAQTPKGSAVQRYVRCCPICHHTFAKIYYGEISEARLLSSSLHDKTERMIFGDAATPQPRPRWMCVGCRLRLWKTSDVERFGVRSNADAEFLG